MLSYNATYTISGSVQPAQLSLLKSKASIQLSTSEGDRIVYWVYHNITRNETGGSCFTYTMYPPQTLDVLDKTMAHALSAQLYNSKKTAIKNRNRIAFTLFTGLILFFATLYFFILPWAAAALAARVPVAYEKKLGDEMYAAMKGDFRIDKERSAYTTAFFDALHIPSEYRIEITVVKSDVSNAFALPGGHIIIYDGLLKSLTSYPQLAALLAHEFIHIEARHSLKSLFRQASATLLFSAFIGDAGAIGAAVLNSANNLKTLSYSRSLESEADADGLKLLAARNIDGKGFIGLFRVLQNEPDAQGPEWTSSHPNLEKRIKNIQKNPVYKQQHAVADAALQHLFLKIKTGE